MAFSFSSIQKHPLFERKLWREIESYLKNTQKLCVVCPIESRIVENPVTDIPNAVKHAVKKFIDDHEITPTLLYLLRNYVEEFKRNTVDKNTILEKIKKANIYIFIHHPTKLILLKPRISFYDLVMLIAIVYDLTELLNELRVEFLESKTLACILCIRNYNFKLFTEIVDGYPQEVLYTVTPEELDDTKFYEPILYKRDRLNLHFLNLFDYACTVVDTSFVKYLYEKYAETLQLSRVVMSKPLSNAEIMTQIDKERVGGITCIDNENMILMDGGAESTLYIDNFSYNFKRVHNLTVLVYYYSCSYEMIKYLEDRRLILPLPVFLYICPTFKYFIYYIISENRSSVIKYFRTLHKLYGSFIFEILGKETRDCHLFSKMLFAIFEYVHLNEFLEVQGYFSKNKLLKILTSDETAHYLSLNKDSDMINYVIELHSKNKQFLRELLEKLLEEFVRDCNPALTSVYDLISKILELLNIEYLPECKTDKIIHYIDNGYHFICVSNLELFTKYINKFCSPPEFEKIVLTLYKMIIKSGFVPPIKFMYESFDFVRVWVQENIDNHLPSVLMYYYFLGYIDYSTLLTITKFEQFIIHFSNIVYILANIDLAKEKFYKNYTNEFMDSSAFAVLKDESDYSKETSLINRLVAENRITNWKKPVVEGVFSYSIDYGSFVRHVEINVKERKDIMFDKWLEYYNSLPVDVYNSILSIVSNLEGEMLEKYRSWLNKFVIQ